MIQLLRIDNFNTYVIHISGTNKEEHEVLHYDIPGANHIGMCRFNNKLNEMYTNTNALRSIWFDSIQHVLSRNSLPQRSLINIQMNTIDAGCVCVNISFHFISINCCHITWSANQFRQMLNELYVIVRRNWKKQLAKPGGRPSIIRAVVATFWREYTIFGLMCGFNDIVLRLLQPWFLGELLKFFR